MRGWGHTAGDHRVSILLTAPGVVTVPQTRTTRAAPTILPHEAAGREAGAPPPYSPDRRGHCGHQPCVRGTRGSKQRSDSLAGARNTRRAPSGRGRDSPAREGTAGLRQRQLHSFQGGMRRPASGTAANPTGRGRPRLPLLFLRSTKNSRCDSGPRADLSHTHKPPKILGMERWLGGGRRDTAARRGQPRDWPGPLGKGVWVSTRHPGRGEGKGGLRCCGIQSVFLKLFPQDQGWRGERAASPSPAAAPPPAPGRPQPGRQDPTRNPFDFFNMMPRTHNTPGKNRTHFAHTQKKELKIRCV